MPAPVIEQTTARRRRVVVAKARFTKQNSLVLNFCERLISFCKGAQKKIEILINSFNQLLETMP